MRSNTHIHKKESPLKIKLIQDYIQVKMKDKRTCLGLTKHNLKNTTTTKRRANEYLLTGVYKG